MSLTKMLVVILALTAAANARNFATPRAQACCADLGCFSNTGDFFSLLNRPISLTPDCDLVPQLRLHFNSREVRVPTEELLDPYNLNTITASHFNVNRETKILIHGFTDHYDWPWWRVMIDAILAEGDYNIVRVNWSKGNRFPYTKGTANTRPVGAYVAKFINLLKDQLSYSPSKIHIIGHSLGAHIAGYAGERVDKVARITGIDPAGPYFTNMPTSVRLDPSDAELVDTLVADGESLLSLGFGSPQAMGHLNFYINGGVSQPGCSSVLTLSALISGPSSFNDSSYDWVSSGMQTFYQTVGCNHWRALSVYIESIPKANCAMKAFECSSYDDFLQAKCMTCVGGRCSQVGYHMDTSIARPGAVQNFYSLTTATPPFCKSVYNLKLKLQPKTAANNARDERGTPYVTLFGLKGTSQKLKLTDRDVSLKPGTEFSFLVQGAGELGQLRSLVLYWVADYSLLSPTDWFRDHYIYIDGDITVQDQDETVTRFRGTRAQVQEEKDWAASAVN